MWYVCGFLKKLVGVIVQWARQLTCIWSPVPHIFPWARLWCDVKDTQNRKTYKIFIVVAIILHFYQQYMRFSDKPSVSKDAKKLYFGHVYSKWYANYGSICNTSFNFSTLIFFFSLFLSWAHPVVFRAYSYQCSVITCGSTQETLCGARNPTRVCGMHGICLYLCAFPGSVCCTLAC